MTPRNEGTQSSEPDLLQRFLAERAGRVFAWGENDCVLLVADWVAIATGAPDPASRWRGRYGDAVAAGNILGWGGLQKAVSRQARALGLARTRTPERGDIGVVQASANSALSGTPRAASIRVTGAWMLVSSNGLMRAEDARTRVLSAWRVPWPRP